jgi:hypothetical protein
VLVADCMRWPRNGGKARMGIFEKDIRESVGKGWEGVRWGVLCEARGVFIGVCF